MAVAQVTCKVCGSTVNKRQTLQVGTDRVCRSHDEAAAYKDKIQSDLYAKAAAEKKFNELVNTYVGHIRHTAYMKSMHINEAVKQLKDGVPEEYRTAVLNRIRALGPLSKQEYDNLLGVCENGYAETGERN